MTTSDIFTFPSAMLRVELTNVGETVNALGNVSGATTINMNLGNVVTATATGAVQWTITNPFASGKSSTVTLILTNGGAGAQTWPSGTQWPGGNEPFMTASGVDTVIFLTVDGGTTWRAIINPNFS
jgi:hypothetical protein